MTEREQFCYDICQAARRLHVYCRRDNVGKLVKITFFDVMARAKIAGEPDSDPQKAMESACSELVKYFAIERNDTTATASPSSGQAHPDGTL